MAKPDPKDLVTRAMLDDAVEAVLDGVGRLFNGLRDEMSPRFAQVGKRFAQIDKRFDQVDERLDKLELGQRHLKGQLKSLKADSSKFSSRRQFEILKARVKV